MYCWCNVLPNGQSCFQMNAKNGTIKPSGCILKTLVTTLQLPGIWEYLHCRYESCYIHVRNDTRKAPDMVINNCLNVIQAEKSPNSGIIELKSIRDLNLNCTTVINIFVIQTLYDCHPEVSHKFMLTNKLTNELILQRLASILSIFYGQSSWVHHVMATVDVEMSNFE